MMWFQGSSLQKLQIIFLGGGFSQYLVWYFIYFDKLDFILPFL